ncbi:MAG: hypothetical protein Kow00109_12950 [Acidobacteriota bacterium]
MATRSLLILPILVMAVVSTLRGVQEEARVDRREARLQDPDHFRWEPPERVDPVAWTKRRELLRRQVLVRTGLWPELPRAPLNAQVFDEKRGQGFRVAKVYFESLPGFLVTGNLYRPDGGGPFPAVLTPHGHWAHGRLENSPEGSVIARCIDLARQGYVVLSVDMVGYGDSLQLPHDLDKVRIDVAAGREIASDRRVFRGEFDFPRERLYGLSLAGLQLWNNIRALDFLASLPEVDAERIGVTGASGGATQTLLLMTVDDRVKVAAPVNILGAEKHPGCRCENPPGLWVDTSTLELAATFAPRPLLLVSATEDPWTHATPEREFPYLLRYWQALGAADNLANVHVAAGHNFNAASRRAVYDWFRRFLQPPGPPVDPVPDLVTDLKALGDLRVFPEKLLPESARPPRRLLEDWRLTAEAVLEQFQPREPAELEGFQANFRPALAALLAIENPRPEDLLYETDVEELRGELVFRREHVGRRDAGDWIALESIRRREDPKGAILLVYPENLGPLALEEPLRPMLPFLEGLTGLGWEVFRVRGYASGRLRVDRCRREGLRWCEAYNRSEWSLAVQDVVTALAEIREIYPKEPVLVMGLGGRGWVAWLGAALFGRVDQVIVDLDHYDWFCDAGLLERAPIPGFRRLGDFRTAALLVYPAGLTLLNPPKTFPREMFEQAAEAVGMGAKLRIIEEAAAADANLTRLVE